MPDTRTLRIAEANDAFRNTLDRAFGHIVVTDAVGALSFPEREALLEKIRTFTDFITDEHNFGFVELDGKTYSFHISYFARGGLLPSPDPTDPAVTVRVLAIIG